MYIIFNFVVCNAGGESVTHVSLIPSLCVMFHTHNPAHCDFPTAVFLFSGLLFTVQKQHHLLAFKVLGHL